MLMLVSSSTVPNQFQRVLANFKHKIQFESTANEVEYSTHVWVCFNFQFQF